ncbi:MAG TPA: NAD(P)/FAD-dependent oxidoreductase [Dehalococcoidia bacterium]|nr:NAD(P)/FAD-dependent oxidoreductase [Dehalococcoidia bacterium]
MRLPEFDVAVLGAGPAGATVAREMAATGARTVLLEREHLPRCKSCAGGMPVRIERMLPFSIQSVIEDSVAGIQVSHRGQARFDRLDAAPFAYMVMPDRFDKLLVDRAMEAGAELFDASPVRHIERESAGFSIRTASGAIRSRLLVGADGANSVVAHFSGLGAGLPETCALESEIRALLPALARWRGLVNVDFGYRPSGYAWLFPKQRLLSVGLVRPRRFAPRRHQDLKRYLDHLGLGSAPIERIVGHKLLFRRAHERIAGERVLLVGDAAGLVDEFTEEGIYYYAIRSGEIAARILRHASDSNHGWIGAYNRAVDRELMPELRAARTIARLFYASLSRMPRAMLQISERVQYFWQAFFRVQRGDSGYDNELRRAPIVAPLARLRLR